MDCTEEKNIYTAAETHRKDFAHDSSNELPEPDKQKHNSESFIQIKLFGLSYLLPRHLKNFFALFQRQKSQNLF